MLTIRHCGICPVEKTLFRGIYFVAFLILYTQLTLKKMENLATPLENDPNGIDPIAPNDQPGAVNDRPKTPDDGISDQGSTTEEIDDNEQGSTNADEREIPELNPDRNDVENQDPTPFDIDESTG